jgi:monothiol glutaredoxin
VQVFCHEGEPNQSQILLYPSPLQLFHFHKFGANSAPRNEQSRLTMSDSMLQTNSAHENVTHQQIAKILSEHRIVLFMKGTPGQPRCGFSAKAVEILQSISPEFHGVDVLADEAIRQGIKSYGNWPTIPQLYVGGELLGGSDIIVQLYNTGELHDLLGAKKPERPQPTISISAVAADAIRAGMADDPGLALHLRIDAKWAAHFQLASVEGHEIKATDQGIEIYMDLATAQRANGLSIDWVETMQGAGLSISNPNAPPPVKKLSVKELKIAFDMARVPLVIDVRPEHDRLRVPFPREHRVLDASTAAALEKLPHDQPIAFLCHFGNSSRQAAEHFRGLGFSEVFNIEGGIDAYSKEIDSSVMRY